MTPLERVLAKLDHPKPSPSGEWTARCPAHDDKHPSLSIKEGDNGGALVYCHAGCPPEEIVEAVGLTLADLMPDASPFSYPGLRPVGPRKANLLPPVAYPTPEAAVAELARRHGPPALQWTYRNVDGEPVGLVVRWNTPTGKDIRPVSKTPAGWVLRGMAAPRPLYRLPDLRARPGERVYVVEGEKCADAVAGLGLLATTSPHGSQSPGKADWTPLAGREVVILPDHDASGTKYAGDVADLLAKLTPPAMVRTLPSDSLDLPAKGDIYDWVERHRHAGHSDAAIREDLERLLAPTPAIPAPEALPAAVLDAPCPFPADCLPATLRRFATATADAMGVPPELPAVLALAVCAAAIGNSYRVKVNQSWTEPAILWAVVLLDSGDLKTPAFKAAMRPLIAQQVRAEEEHRLRRQAYEAEQLEYEWAVGQWKKEQGAGTPPAAPQPPVPVDYFTSDTTIEGMARLLDGNRRGGALARDELAGWFASFGQYKGGRGGDEGAWLELYTGGTLKVDRASKRLFVVNASVSILGTCQPEVFARALQGPGKANHFDNGLAARFLVAQPAVGPKRWRAGTLPAAVTEAYAALIDGLLDLPFQVDDTGQAQPRDLPLTPDAQARFAEFVNAHGAAKAAVEPAALRYHYAKLEGAAARLALILHLARRQDGEAVDPEAVDLASVAAALELIAWFKAEAHRVYARFSESPGDRLRRELVDLVRRRGGAIAPRELSRTSRRYHEPGAAEQALQELVAAGLGHWSYGEVAEAGGRPSKRFMLGGADANTPVLGSASQGCVTGIRPGETGTGERGEP